MGASVQTVALSLPVAVLKMELRVFPSLERLSVSVKSRMFQPCLSVALMLLEDA